MLKSETLLVIADDHPIMLKGLQQELQRIGYQHIEVCTHGLDAFNKITECSPNVAILDIQMPVINGLEVAKKLIENKYEIPIILMTYHKEEAYLAMAKKIGIQGYMLKEDAISELDHCIREVMHGRTYYSSSLEQNYLHDTHQILDALNDLTSMELAVIKCVAHGLRRAEIAEELNISARTVEKHRSNIISKIGVETISGSLNDWARDKRELIEEL